MTLLQLHWLFFSPKIYSRSALELRILYLLVSLPMLLFPKISQVLLNVIVTKETFRTTLHKIAITYPLMLYYPALLSLFPSPSMGGNLVCLFLYLLMLQNNKGHSTSHSYHYDLACSRPWSRKAFFFSSI